MKDPMERFNRAHSLGLLALIRLRAEVLLDREDVPADDREELERIAAAPTEADRDWLGHFDYLFEADEEKENPHHRPPTPPKADAP